MDKYLSRWTLAELKQFSNERRLLVARDRRTGRVNKRSCYNAVKRYDKRTRPTLLYKLKLAQLKERFRAENIPLLEHFNGKRGHIKKTTSPPLKSFTSPQKKS